VKNKQKTSILALILLIVSAFIGGQLWTFIVILLIIALFIESGINSNWIIEKKIIKWLKQND